MIRRLGSELPTFKTVEFHEGLNVLLADRAPGATDRQTRNGAGKTSLVELIHFLLGAKCAPGSLFRSEALEPHAFSMVFDLRQSRVTVARCGGRPAKVGVQTAATTDWPIQPSVDVRLGGTALSNDDWKTVLGAQMFGLPEGGLEGGRRFGPSFRSLFSYFARRQMDGGFQRPQQHSNKQQFWDQQVAVSYLLNIDWSIPQRFQELRRRETAIRELRKAAKEGALGPVIGTAADLMTKVTVAEARVRRLREQLANFRVVAQYRELEQEASRLTVRLGDLSDANTIDEQLVQQTEAALAAERPPAFADVTKVYAEAGVVLPGLVSKRFEDLQDFHRSVIENRRSHLQQEIDAARGRIAAREREKADLDARRAQVMGILKSGGALDHFARLQEELSRGEAEAEALRQRFQAAEQMESNKAELDIERAKLHKRLQDDYHEERELIEEAILTFEELSSALYEKAGSLTITPTTNGPQFEVKIESSRSKGITNMQIFCFDLMLLELWSKRNMGPGFLVHDSHLFDGVDERQVAKALQLGAQRAEALGAQYIVTMNSDALPRAAFPPDFRVDDFILDVRLTDRTEDGGLFGIRFQ